jgi:hypothetical protein
MINYSYFSYTRVIAAVIAFTGIFLFWPGNLFFLNDDFLHLYLTSQGKWLQQNSFRPVCDLSMWLDYKIWGLNAVGFHLTNTILHIICTFLVYKFSKRLLEKYHQSAIASSNALLIASVFFVYAFHAETIYWVIGRSSSLGAIFFLLSSIFYLGRDRSTQNKFAAALFFIIGLLTYESVWIMPAVFATISWMDVKQQNSDWRIEAKYIIASVVLLSMYFVVRFMAIEQLVADYEGSKFLNLDFRGLSVNFLKLVLRSFSRQTGDFYLIGLAFLIAVTSFISFLITRRKTFAAAIVVIWIVSLLPYLSLGIDTFGSEGERYLYLPSIFLSIIIGIGMVNAARIYKYIISLLFFFVHIIFLHQNRNDYVVASAVTRSAMEELQKLSDKRTIYVKQLPIENNGALIFRNGFDVAVKLFTKSVDKKIVIISYYEGNYSFFNGITEQDWIDELPGENGKDAVLDFSNSSLTVYR